MHVSLDSALGRQRRLNSVGESVLQIAPSAAAAYSLRSLTGGDPKVVRVRRGSDNHEQDFTASEVSSGALTSFVNAQVVAPLDIRALTATGRDGDFLIAKAAYSLRSLGTRQATLAATGDTVARADGKFVVQVRRSSDDALKSFTATEVTDGTLLSFVGTGGSDNGFVKTWYDQSVTTQAGDTATGNHAVQATAASQPKIVNAGALVVDSGIAGLDFDGSTSARFLVATSVSGLESPFSMFSTSVRDAGSGYTVSLSRSAAANRYFAVQEAETSSLAVPRNSTSGVSVSDSVSGTDRLTFALTTGATSTSVGTLGSAVTTTTDDYGDNFTSATGLDQIAIGLLRTVNPTGYFDGRIREIIFYTSDQTDNRTAIEANIGEAYSIDLPSGVDPGFDQVDGFVETWYDQSGNNKDATQTTASLQPKIVNAGSLLTDGIDFDQTSQAGLITGSFSLTQAFTTFSVSHIDDASASQGIWSTAASATDNFNTASFFRNDDGFAVNAGATLTTAGTIDYVADRTYLQTNVVNGGSSSIFVDGATGATGNAGSTNPSGVLIIGYFKSGGYFNLDGAIKEIIIYDSDQTSNRVALETNIAAANGVTLS